MQVRQLADWPRLPFCSEKCRLADLGRWLDGAYRLPSDDEEFDEASDSDGEPGA